MKKFIATVASTAMLLSGCASSSKEIAAASVSPLQYSGFECTQLQAESARLSGKITQLGGRLDEASSNDKAIMGVGLILFWPALFALGGTKDQEADFAKTKGEFEALQQAAIQKNCLQPKTDSLQAAKTEAVTQAKKEAHNAN